MQQSAAQCTDTAQCTDATQCSFNFTKIDKKCENIDIIADPPAYVNEDGIHVTPNDGGLNQLQKAGRAMHKDPLVKNNVRSRQFYSTLQIDKKRMGENNKKALGVVVGSFILVISVLALLGFVLWNKSSNKAAKKEDELAIELSGDNEFEVGTGPKKFSYGELIRATNYFAEEQKLGEGGFGGIYRGFLRESNLHVAVKRISKESKQGIKEYLSKVKIISRLRHRNLVQLLGWCHEKREFLLVYEVMEYGSLDYHLFKKKSFLTWAIRYKIAKGLASALLYLHEECEQCIVHRDIKSSNVRLDSNFNPKLGDFGLARLVDHDKGSQTTILAGTIGYMAPECLVTGKANKESDVFSFGVVALEIACGRKPISLKVPKSQMRMIDWVWDLYGTSRLLEALDSKICADFVQEEVECLMIVGLWCAHPDHNLRPSIRQAIHVLNFEAPLPILPTKMPVPTYFAPSMTSSSSLAALTNGSTATSDPSASYLYTSSIS
ncbi:hypothetical protein TEA_010691 [Camellia sinensis var. sinensis]|uniref:Protein kinase domain-containing protein n=2 Tax=Camellia sinensis TaxID=4442 RepID=A0A4S4E4D5_CAMSN|nr:hypothetical protein TEA_010691 [Camellia sinensis var. sinensis]